MMDRDAWDWTRFVRHAGDVLTIHVPRCSLSLEQPLTVRLGAHLHDHGQRLEQEIRTFVFDEGDWFERHVGKASGAEIESHIRDLDGRMSWWVDANVEVQLCGAEVRGLPPDELAGILAAFAEMRRQVRA